MQLSVHAGYMSKPAVVKSMEAANLQGEVRVFVHLTQNSDWLCQAVAGQSHKDHPLARCSLMQMLLDESRNAIGYKRVATPASVEAEVEPEPESESEEDLLRDDEDAEVQNAAAKNKRRRTPKFRPKPILATLPMEPPEVDLASPRKPISLFVRSAKEIWLESKHVAWAVAFLHAQWSNAGVPKVQSKISKQSLVKAAAAVAAEAEASATPRWNFEEKTWAVRVEVDGVPVERQLSPEQLTEEEAKTVDPSLGGLKGMAYPALKSLTFRVLERWAEAPTLL